MGIVDFILLIQLVLGRALKSPNGQKVIVPPWVYVIGLCVWQVAFRLFHPRALVIYDSK